MADELTQENFDKMRERIQILEELIFVEMKLTVDRTDISACDKINKVKAFIEQVREDVEDDEEDEVTAEADAKTTDPTEEVKPEEADGDDASKKEAVNDLKRPAVPTFDFDSIVKAAKLSKMAADGVAEGVPADAVHSDEEGEVDCCVVCGLHRGVFKEDIGRELHHYLSHGFNILKEFDILKPDDSVFLICNICNSPFPRKCHVNFRKHLVAEHKDRIVEIFREV